MLQVYAKYIPAQMIKTLCFQGGRWVLFPDFEFAKEGINDSGS